MKIHYLGAENCVTGSCHLVQGDRLNIMVDCGLVQGRDRAVEETDWPIEPDQVDVLILTHAHIDHIGRLPWLIKEGFRGDIICTHPTRALLAPMLKDAMGLSGLSREAAEKLWRRIDDQAWGFEYGEIFELHQGWKFSLGRAGHILGSCWVRLMTRSGETVIFSGDLGSPGRPLLRDPEVPPPADLLVLESTYGDRLHPPEKDRIAALGAVLAHCLADGGKVLIPVFALGRAQELLYEMDRLFSDPGYGFKTRPPVFVDSPLGLEVTKIYAGLKPFWDKEARDLWARGDHPLDFDGLYAVARHSDHEKLLGMAGPAVILAGSGMCTGGRILNHLKAGIHRPENDVVFVGYQARGTLGRRIQRAAGQGVGQIEIQGERRRVRAGVHLLDGYSAHADQAALVDWVAAVGDIDMPIKLVHGEPEAQQALRQALHARGSRAVTMGEKG
jgi:metallo-beta-lactamase family protein